MEAALDMARQEQAVGGGCFSGARRSLPRVSGDPPLRRPASVLLALPFLLGGCAAAALAPAMVELAREGAVRGQRYTDASFPPAAEEACRARATRHGRVEITRAEPHGADAIRVYGTIDRFGGSPGRSFACVFRRDGVMTHFKVT